MIGIVAGRLKEKYHLPTIVFAPADTNAICDNDFIKGSARSIAGIHIRDAIEAVATDYPDLISHFGGHAMAAGLTIEKGKFELFCQAFNKVMQSLEDDVFAETLFTDGQLAPQEFSLEFLDYLDNLTVWGHGFLPPMFDGVFVVQDFRVLKERHLKLWLSYDNLPMTLEAVWFNADFDKVNIAQVMRGVSNIHALFVLEKNDFNGQIKLQLNIKKAVLI